MSSAAPSLTAGGGRVLVPVDSSRVALTRLSPIFTPASLPHLAMMAVIALFPFQVLGIGVGTTKIDLSVIVFALFVLMMMVWSHRATTSLAFKIFLGVYLTTEIMMFFVGPTTLNRFASAFVWLTAAILLYGRREQIPIHSQLAFALTLGGTVLVGLSLIYQYVIDRLERPAGLMAEPSPAGMVLLAGVAGLIISARWAPTQGGKIASYGGALLLFGISLITKTTHILSFAIALVGVGTLSRSFNARTVLLGLCLLAAVYGLLTYDPHYQSRIDIGGASSNLSLMSWLQGFDQMMESLRAYPLTGAGLGGTGQFDFYSEYSEGLFLAGLGDMNRQDAYSGLFRLVIELGPILMGVVLYAMGLRFRELWQATGEGALPVGREAQAQMFLFAFAVTLIVGILLKEPTYSRSHFALAALLFCVVPLRAVVRLPADVAARLRPAR